MIKAQLPGQIDYVELLDSAGYEVAKYIYESTPS